MGGGLACTAVFAVFLPTAWMAAIRGWLGLGEFPDAAVTQYLTRSVSVFYAMLGGLTILASLLGNYFCQSCDCIGDINRGGIVNLDDLAELIGHWGQGPGYP